jgi:hypothetical protein
MSQDILDEAKASRHELCRGWPAETAAHRDLRHAGRLLAAWDDTRKVWCVPGWQLRDGQPTAEMEEILSLLRGADCLGIGGWGAIEWFLSLHVLLDGRSPAELLAVDPRSVVNAACAEFTDLHEP